LYYKESNTWTLPHLVDTSIREYYNRKEKKMEKKMKERRVYTKEFKTGTVAPAEKGEKPVRQVAGDLGVNENVLYRWIRSSHLRAGRKPVMAYRFMQANQGRYAVREMAGLFGVSSGAYYQWAKHGETEEPERCRVAPSYSGDTAEASQPLWQSAGAGGTSPPIRGNG
jgi:transposase-like protein